MEQQPDQQGAAGAQPPPDNANHAGGNISWAFSGRTRRRCGFRKLNVSF
jgi:hypothetical protein